MKKYLIILPLAFLSSCTFTAEERDFIKQLSPGGQVAAIVAIAALHIIIFLAICTRYFDKD